MKTLKRGKLSDTVDAIICNFSLLGKESVESVFRTLPRLLNPRGAFIVQTLHPVVVNDDFPYQDGWREGTWAGIGIADDIGNPAPWYFRTLESWIGLFSKNGFRVRELREPIHPVSMRPASVIFIGKHLPGDDGTSSRTDKAVL